MVVCKWRVASIVQARVYRFAIVIPRFVRLHVEIIHELFQVVKCGMTIFYRLY